MVEHALSSHTHRDTGSTPRRRLTHTGPPVGRGSIHNFNNRSLSAPAEERDGNRSPEGIKGKQNDLTFCGLFIWRIILKVIVCLYLYNWHARRNSIWYDSGAAVQRSVYCWLALSTVIFLQIGSAGRSLAAENRWLPTSTVSGAITPLKSQQLAYIIWSGLDS